VTSLEQRLSKAGTAIPEVSLPAPGVDLEAWAVVACDQFTQDREYWKRVEDRVGEAPSTLRMIFPEAFLEDGGRARRIAEIHASMRAYLSGGVFAPPERALVYIERATPHRPLRRGLILAVDLERYEWAPEARPLIRATEGTVKERIPPRMEIRRGAPLEAPHILLLIDDDERRLVEGLGERAKKRAPRYATDLMLGSGSQTGWTLSGDDDFEYLAAELERLAGKARTRYGTGSAAADPFLFAVGDGNHSLATAKAVWDEYKRVHAGDAGLLDHPARWALVEVENIYDEGIVFEPIHRALFGVGADAARAALAALPGFASRPVADPAELARLVETAVPGKTRYGLVSAAGSVLIETSATGLSTEPLQPLLDAFVAAGPGRSIDYLHGADETVRVGTGADAVGLLLPPVGKSDLFATVARSGPLPRKSFSMGEAVEKRFYLECRRLFV